MAPEAQGGPAARGIISSRARMAAHLAHRIPPRQRHQPWPGMAATVIWGMRLEVAGKSPEPGRVAAIARRRTLAQAVRGPFPSTAAPVSPVAWVAVARCLLRNI